jgi:hypothetical protein
VQAHTDAHEFHSVHSLFAANRRSRRRRRLALGQLRRDDLWLGYDAPGLVDPEWCGPIEVRDEGGSSYQATTRLTGSMQPTDGRYHWQGQLDFVAELRPGRDVQLRVDGGAWTTGRITETTAWGLSVTGVGAPPFPLAALEIEQQK